MDKVSRKTTNGHRLLGIVALGALYVGASASYESKVDSVHFYGTPFGDLNRPIDFGRAPQSVKITGWNSENWRSGSYNTSGIYSPAQREDWDTQWFGEQSWHRQRARNFEIKGQYARAIRAYNELEPTPNILSFIKDREESFQNSHAQGFKDYLRLRYLIEFGEIPRQAIAVTQLAQLRVSQSLLPQKKYALVAARSDRKRWAASADFLQIFTEFPKSNRAEPALVMAARELLKEKKDEPSTPQQIARAEAILARLETNFPQTRFRNNILGWRGRAALLKGRFDTGLAFYGRQSRCLNPNEAWMGYLSIADVCLQTKRSVPAAVALLRQRLLKVAEFRKYRGTGFLRDLFANLSHADLINLQREIRKDSDLLEAYVGFRIEDTNLEHKDEAALMSFATKSLNRLKAAPASLLCRIAQINYNAGDYRSAHQLARRTLSKLTDRETKSRATYVLGASLARLGKPKTAIRVFEKLVKFPSVSYIDKSAKEYLAILHESHGNPVRSTQLYLKLGYWSDLAFMADAKLSPKQLSEFLSLVPRRIDNSSYGSYYLQTEGEVNLRDILTYTLGLRYLRKEQYRFARSTFQKMSKKTRSNWGMAEKSAQTMQESLKDHDDETIERSDPLILVGRLEALTNRSLLARTSEARAQAMYDKASLIYHRRNLLFYSPGIWEGMRSFTLSYGLPSYSNTSADKKALSIHFHEHECLAHSLRICDELVQKYPKSKLVPKALYTAAISAERLANLNEWWRNRSAHLFKLSINRLTRLIRDYPNDSLFKSSEKYKKEFNAMLRGAPNY